MSTCAAYTKKGHRCSCSAKKDSKFCGVHRKMTLAENERRSHLAMKFPDSEPESDAEEPTSPFQQFKQFYRND
jgi:hypothetical protein